VPPEQAALELLAQHRGAVAVVNHAMAEDDVTAVLQHPAASVASDGGVLRPSGRGRPHPRSFGTSTRVLGHYVRDRGSLSLADAVRKITSLPASRLRLADRGVLRAGAVADVVVFDPNSVVDRSTFEDPWQLSTGVRDVLVGGTFALRDGELTGERPGKVLRRRS
jgi:N-acyl-D-amino-acid deacylase